MVVESEYYIQPTALGLGDYLSAESPQTYNLEGERVFMMTDALQMAIALRNDTGIEANFANSTRRFDMPWASKRVDGEELDNDKRSQFTESTGANQLFARLSGFENWEKYLKMVRRAVRSKPNPKIYERFDGFFNMTREPLRLLEIYRLDRKYDVFADIVAPDVILPEEEASVPKLVATAAVEHTRVEATDFLNWILIDLMLSRHDYKRQGGLNKAETAARAVIEFSEQSSLTSPGLSRASTAILRQYEQARTA